jgi:hypothetical protein
VAAAAEDGLRYLDGGGALSRLSTREDVACAYADMLAKATRTTAIALAAAGDHDGAARELARAAAAVSRPGFAAHDARMYAPHCFAADVLVDHGSALRQTGRTADSVAPLRAAVAAARATHTAAAGAPRAAELLAKALGALACSLLMLGHAEPAAACCAEEVALREACGDAVGAAGAQVNLSNAQQAVAVGMKPEFAAPRLEAARAAAEAAAATAEALCADAAALPPLQARVAQELRGACVDCLAGMALAAGERDAALAGYTRLLQLAQELEAAGPAGRLCSTGVPPGSCALAVTAHAGLAAVHAARAVAGEDAEGHAKAGAARVARFAALGRPPPAECSICFTPLALDDASDEGRPRVLRCHHCFHDACISRWLDDPARLRATCPTCRQWASGLTPDALAEVAAAGLGA